MLKGDHGCFFIMNFKSCDDIVVIGDACLNGTRPRNDAAAVFKQVVVKVRRHVCQKRITSSAVDQRVKVAIAQQETHWVVYAQEPPNQQAQL